MSQSNGYLNNVGARIELLGIPNIISPFAQFNSASRVSMFNHHLSQAMVLNSPEFNKTFTGVEHKLIDYTFNRSKRKYPCEIVAIIPKYEGAVGREMFSVHSDKCPMWYVIVLTKEPNGVSHLDYFTVERYFMGANGFGWVPVIENGHRLKVGEILDVDTVITHSPAVQGDMYCNGTNLNIVFGSFAETIEDAFIIGESARKKLETTQISQVTLDIKQDQRPLNINGTERTERFLPDIGSQVRQDGVLCGFRPPHWTSVVADSDPEALREPLPLQDNLIYVPSGAEIVDLTFNINRNKINNSCYQQAVDYMENNTRSCWEQIYSAYQKFRGRYKLTAKMDTLVTTSIYRMIAQGSRNRTFMAEFNGNYKNREIEGANRQIVDFMQVIVTYKVPRTVHNGDKLSDLQGAKHLAA